MLQNLPHNSSAIAGGIRVRLRTFRLYLNQLPLAFEQGNAERKQYGRLRLQYFYSQSEYLHGRQREDRNHRCWAIVLVIVNMILHN